MSISEIYRSDNDTLYKATANAPGPQGKLPFTAEMLMDAAAHEVAAADGVPYACMAG